MKPNFDHEKIKQAVSLIIEALGDDPEREGLVGTPDRVARMYDEIFEGMRYTNDEIAQMFNKCFEQEKSRDLVLVKDIECFSWCEHHLALMYDMQVSVAYIPKDRVLGLSKIARIADMVAKRLQLQERIGADIAEILQEITESEDVAVVIEGTHSCMTARGIKKGSAATKTYTLRGRFKDDISLQMRLNG